MKPETLQTFTIFAIIAMFGFIIWAIWHHYQDQHDIYRIQGPNWEYEYRPNDNGYRDRDYYNFEYRYNDPYYRHYRRNGNFRIGPVVEWNYDRRYR